ncbi:ABC transporter permease [Xanthobacter sp. KR7-225]|uniref:ABC transporter permease n=1 Tax=Xanthobacter sp. KR7-225 TaxID=3156613 RepID=UPI0032B32AB5
MSAVTLYRALLGIALLTVWYLVSKFLGTEFFLSTPGAVGESIWKSLVDGSMVYHLSITLTEAAGGFAIGAITGVILGLLLGRTPQLADICEPYLMAFYSLPKAALAPLFVLWLGIGIDMKIIFAASIVFFFVFFNTYIGVKQVSPEQITILRLMGANEFHLLGKVVIPSAIVWFFAGLRLSVPNALIGAVVGEIIASNRGLGFMLAHAASQFDTAGTFAALAGIMFLALAFNLFVKLAEKAFMPWRKVEEDREFSV